MKTNKRQLTNWNLLTLSLLALLLVGANDASARVRVRATVYTPYGAVRIDNSHSGRYSAPRRHLNYTITRQDRRIAKRLARYTGVSKREILRLRRQGYRWSEIGRRLDVSRRVVRAAKHQDTWQRFLRDERRYASRGRFHRGHGGRHDHN